MERLQKIIANSGYCSRRKAEELIKQGLVKVNGQVITELGTKASYKDYIEVEGCSLNKKEEKVYYLLNKPRGVITSTSDDKGRKTVIDLIQTNTRIYPVGRLDYDTTGLLILTNDGDLANLMTHPKNNIDKVYIAKLKGIIPKEKLKTLEKGILLDNHKTSKCQTKLTKIDKKTNTCIIKITIHEGKYHQVKRMFETIGYEVLKLKREQIAFLTLNNLKSGEYRQLSIKEVKNLYSLF